MAVLLAFLWLYVGGLGWPPSGITVRDCASFGLPDHVRIAAPMPKDLSLVLQPIRELDG